jgi:prefoldin subunit 5
MGKDVGIDFYLKSEVDEAIAELKAKLDKAIAERDSNQVCIDSLKGYIPRLKEEKDKLKDKLEQEQLLRSHWNEDDYAMVNELERLSNENEKLKQKLDNVQASMYADLEESHKMEVEQLLMEIVKLKEDRRWRKYPDEKPSEDTRYIICGESGFRDADRWMLLKEKGCMGFGFYDYGVKYWMPIPKAPEEVK